MTASLDSRIAVALERIGRAARTSMQRDATRLGLTPLQLALLVRLGSEPPPEHRVTELARELDVRQPTASGAIKALETKGLVTRTRHPTNNRLTDIALTVTGREATTDLAISSSLERAVASADDASKEQTFAVLIEIITHLNRSGVLGVARTCPTCDHYRPARVPDPPARCNLLDVDLTPDRFQIDCADHEVSHP